VDNKISAIGKNIDIPSGTKIYDAAGMSIMPGIVDAHGHYGGGNQSYLHVLEENNASLLSPLMHGVTTLYEVYGSVEKDAWVRDRLESGKSYGSRLFTVGPPIFGAKYRKGLMKPINSLEDAKQALGYNKAFGAEAVKDYTQFTRRARHAGIAAARELGGLNVVAETAGNLQMNLTQIIDGITGLEHSMGMTPLYSDVTKLMAATDVGITPTLIVVYNGPTGESYFHTRERLWENEKLLKFQTRDELLRFRRPTFYWEDEHYAPTMAASLKPLYGAGVSLQLGAHGQMSGLDAQWEMELYQQGGFTPAEVIEISTINGAKYHGFGDELGSLEVGKFADLVVMTKNPLEDVRNVRAIKWVMQNGVLYNGDDASRIYPNPAPTPEIYFQK
ncbi:MAG: amidohydrolase family protein, partial [Sphingomonadales bacterium]